MTTPDPAQWLADYNQNLVATAANAHAAGASLADVSGQATSPHGEVAVRVSASGALEDIRLAPAARRLEAEQLARLILATTRAAQRGAGARVLEIMTGYVGDGPVLDLVKQHLPAETLADTVPVGVAPPFDRRDDDEYFTNPPEINQ